MTTHLHTVEYHDGCSLVSLQRRVDVTVLDRLTDQQRDQLDQIVAELLDLAGGSRDDAAATIAAQLLIDYHIERAYETEAQRRGVLAL